MRTLVVLALAGLGGAALADATPPAPTKAQRTAYRKHLAAGRRLGKQKRWGEAVGEFEAALTALPMDARALGELGFAAYQAGDYKKARKADELAVRVAAEPKVRAASYYNLGLVAEAEHDTASAAAAYRVSLALRPGNATVEKALARTGQAPAAAPSAVVDQPPCPAPGTAAAICTCLLADLASSDTPDAGDDKPTCDEASSGSDADDTHVIAAPPAGYDVLEVDDHPDHERTLYLTFGAGAKQRVIASLGTAYNPGMMGISEHLAVDTLDVRTIGAHQVLWIETTHEHDDVDNGINEAESTTEHEVTICPYVAGAPRCALSVTVDYAYERDVVDPDRDDAEARASHTKGLPLHDEHHLAIELGADGVATVTLKKGAAPDDKGVLGPHKLW